MRTEKEIIEKLNEYSWYYNNIIETEDVKGFIEALEWILGKEE